MSETAEESRPKRGKGAKLLLALGAVVVSLLAAELVARLSRRLTGEPYSVWRTRAEMERTVESMTRRVPGADGAQLERDETETVNVLHPYYAFDSERGLEQVRKDLAYFANGRGDEPFDVLVLGGSVAAGFANRGNERLVELLGNDPRLAGRPIKLHGYARGAYKEPQQLMVLGFLLTAGFEPDAVLSIDGFNEVALGNANAVRGTHPLYPAVSQWAPVVQGGFTDRAAVDLLLAVRAQQIRATRYLANVQSYGLAYSCLLGRFAESRLERIKSAWVAAQSRYLDHLALQDEKLTTRGPRHDGDAAATVQLAVDGWVQASQSLHATCAARSIPFLLVVQPTLHDTGSKPLTADEVATGGAPDSWIEGVRLGYPLLRDAADRLARLGVPVLDATGVFADAPQTLYFDACHFDRAGNEILAEHVAAALLDLVPDR